MALINCKECGKEISSTVKKCPYCGFKMKKKMNRKKKIVLIISIIIIIIILMGVTIGIFINNIFIPSSKYAKAEKYLQANKYEEAINIFRELQGYKDVNERIQKAYYDYGNYLLENDKFDEAIVAFTEAGEYSDALEQISKTKEKKAEISALEKHLENKELLKNAYKECTDGGTKLSGDGLSISVDASSKYDYESLLDVYTIVEKLKLPDSLIDAMCSTNSLMGRQIEQHGDFEISWSYHPDNGLDVIFKIIK